LLFDFGLLHRLVYEEGCRLGASPVEMSMVLRDAKNAVQLLADWDGASEEEMGYRLDKFFDLIMPLEDLHQHAAPLNVIPKRMPDGPSIEGFFYHAGIGYRFPDALQWRLLKALFGRGAVPVEEVIESVYPGEGDEADAKLRGLIHRTERKFENYNLRGYDIERPMSGFISLRCPP
jgi:hypothetical protein